MFAVVLFDDILGSRVCCLFVCRDKARGKDSFIRKLEITKKGKDEL